MKYLYYLIARAAELIGSEGYKRHFKILKEFDIEYINPLPEQQKIAAIFAGVKGAGVDDYVLRLKDEDTRQQFERAFKRFAKQMDVILPDVAAKPYLPDLKSWGKVQNAARNRYRDPGLNIRDAGEKVRKLVEDHIISTGVDPKIPPVDMMAANFRESVEQIKSPESRASEIESAIKHHLIVLMAEVTQHGGDGLVGDKVHEDIKATSQFLVKTFDEATQIVDFFHKPDEVKRMKKEIKRAILDCSYADKALVAVVQDRFMDLAKRKFG